MKPYEIINTLIHEQNIIHFDQLADILEVKCNYLVNVIKEKSEISTEFSEKLMEHFAIFKEFFL